MVRAHPDNTLPQGPIRTCVGCRARAAKPELLRVVAGVSEHGPAVIADPGGAATGRGAYVHPTLECLELAVRRRAFTRALRAGDGLASAPLRDYLRRQISRNDRTDRQKMEQQLMSTR